MYAKGRNNKFSNEKITDLLDENLLKDPMRK